MKHENETALTVNEPPKVGASLVAQTEPDAYMGLIQTAVQGGAGVEQLEKLMELAERAESNAAKRSFNNAGPCRFRRAERKSGCRVFFRETGGYRRSHQARTGREWLFFLLHPKAEFRVWTARQYRDHCDLQSYPSRWLVYR